jgi:hypothetical protein
MKMMKLWLDDVRPMPEGYDRHARTADEAIALLETGDVSHISFDHDLGTEKDGNDVAIAIEKMAHDGIVVEMEWTIHSANPVGRKEIEMTMKSAQRWWDEWEERGCAH